MHVVRFEPASVGNPMTGRGHRYVELLLCRGCITTMEDDLETQFTYEDGSNFNPTSSR